MTTQVADKWTGRLLLEHMVRGAEQLDEYLMSPQWLGKGGLINSPWPDIEIGVEIVDPIEGQYKISIGHETLAAIDTAKQVGDKDMFWQPIARDDLIYILDNALDKFGIPDRVTAQ